MLIVLVFSFFVTHQAHLVKPLKQTLYLEPPEDDNFHCAGVHLRKSKDSKIWKKTYARVFYLEFVVILCKKNTVISIVLHKLGYIIFLGKNP